MKYRDKNEVYNELHKLIDGYEVNIDFLFDYFSTDDLEGFLEHMKNELEV